MSPDREEYDMVCQRAVTLIVDLCLHNSTLLDQDTCQDYLLLLSSHSPHHQHPEGLGFANTCTLTQLLFNLIVVFDEFPTTWGLFVVILEFLVKEERWGMIHLFSDCSAVLRLSSCSLTVQLFSDCPAVLQLFSCSPTVQLFSNCSAVL
ncbi:hypothetical protein D4764_08G0011940 [Takifugu flavidus]|uniref:Uncharacterized protein n=1 Tax=Takifugu flavidus TaxID=433684 RepID=A0A5C6MV11_9TELE|nr:hypothetical protein D4764_08G0011940 [Takifugu flavidus]